MTATGYVDGAAHSADTTSVHGIANTGLLETTAGAQAKADTAQSAAIAAAAALVDDLSGVSNAGTARTNLGAQATIVFRPEDPAYGASGLGVVDDTAAVLACFAAANALKKTLGTYSDPGATVRLKGKYNLATLAAPVDVMCNVESDGAIFYTPAGYADAAVRVGQSTSGHTMQNMTVRLPSVIGATVATPPLTAGSVGVLITNIYSSSIDVGKVAYFETSVQCGGKGWGVAYCNVTFRTLTYGKVMLALKNLDSGGWANSNNFYAGSITGSIAWAGRRASGYRAVLLDGTGSNYITGNNFYGTSFESDVWDYAIEFKNAYQNQFYGCRHEQGINAAAVTVSGDTITSTGHVMAVDDMVIFTGTSAPTGMSFDQPYYVVAVPTSDTFKVATARGGAAITFTSAGTSVAYSRPQRVRYENASSNIIDLPMTPLTWIDRVYGTGVPAALAGNLVRYGQLQVMDSYAPNAWPIHRLRNRYVTGATVDMPLYATYPYDVDPMLAPESWGVALSQRGLLWPSGTRVREGSGSPEGVVAAPPGSVYLNRAGGAVTAVYLKASGTSTTGWSAVGIADPDTLTGTGELSLDRALMVSGSTGGTSGTLDLAYFTAKKTETINTLTVWTGTTAAAPTPSLIRFAVYSIAANGDATLVASTVNDTALLSAANTAYPVALSASWSKVAGQRYAAAKLVISGATMPTFQGQLFVGTVNSTAYLSLAPRITGRLTGQTDLPGTFAESSVTTTQYRIGTLLT